MQCTKCKTSLLSENRYCPRCGHKVARRTRLFWLFSSFGLVLLLLLSWLAFASLTSEILEETIQKQLQAIRAQQLAESYYAYTSHSFQHTTSLDQYKEFVHTYPVLLHHQKIVFGPRIKDNKGGHHLYLATAGRNEAEVHYQLVREEGRWKIDGIELVEYRKSLQEDTRNTTAAMIAPIEQQLSALRSGDLLGAYKGIVSKQFQEKTPLEAFKAFVIVYPILTTHQEYDFKEHEMDNNRGIVTILLNPDREATPVEYRMVLENDLWKIQMMRLVATGDKQVAPAPPDSNAMIELVRSQLALLQEGKIRQVYDEMLAKETQAETSFENFKTFVNTYRALGQHTAVNIRSPTVEQSVGHLIAEVQNDQGTTLVEYTLSLQGGAWKITGMHIADTPEETGVQLKPSPSSFKVRDLIETIETFLSLLRSKEDVKAYNDLTSKDFQYSNSQHDFDLFFVQHPEFAQSTGSTFEREIINNAIATFSGKLILPGNKVVPVEFDLVQEQDKWKILHIYALPAEESLKAAPEKVTTSVQPLEFDQLLLGTKVDDQGQILNPVTVFKPDSGDIYARLFILHGSPGTEIQLLLRHIDSGSSLKPVTATLTDRGNETFDLYFFSPSKGMA